MNEPVTKLSTTTDNYLIGEEGAMMIPGKRKNW